MDDKFTCGMVFPADFHDKQKAKARELQSILKSCNSIEELKLRLLISGFNYSNDFEFLKWLSSVVENGYWHPHKPIAYVGSRIYSKCWGMIYDYVHHHIEELVTEDYVKSLRHQKHLSVLKSCIKNAWQYNKSCDTT